ncbi:formate dehydrogenase accessory sulfurtransferase FdhD [Neptuniibacter halophilus]|uniref:formate dehydrogenase accessory sulfurtransferase FdhD n=1 Tax=Neptuniibacter halophilus TaxID=651666 RepID=UPI002572EBA1|nr:formate dehydrogenase accessory sulfurtransferase FdhD [Neptuniibacter halophilus]
MALISMEKSSSDELNLGLEHCHAQTRVERRYQGNQISTLDQIAAEVPVAMVYNGISHAVMMASPSDLEAFAIGFSLSEGIIQKADEIYELELVADPGRVHQGVEIHISITSQRAMALKERRRNLTGRTGCGLCGAESLHQAIRPLAAVKPTPLVAAQSIEKAVASLADHQPLQQLTGACHGAAWCDRDGNIQLVREDIGRHNALDKLLGTLCLSDQDLSDGFVLVSSRASYEMVHKSSSCGVSTLVAVSAASQLAIDMAEESGLNLIGFARSGRHVVYHASQPDADLSE